jgi:flagellar basal body-associated protein FliL
LLIPKILAIPATACEGLTLIFRHNACKKPVEGTRIVLVGKMIVAALAATLFSVSAASAGEQLSAPANKRRPTPLESYVMVDPITVTVIHHRAARGLLVIEFGLDVPDGTLRTRVEHDLPRLRDVYIRTMSTYASGVVRPHEQADVESISGRLQRVTDYILGTSGAKILLSHVVVQARG